MRIRADPTTLCAPALDHPPPASEGPPSVFGVVVDTHTLIAVLVFFRTIIAQVLPEGHESFGPQNGSQAPAGVPDTPAQNKPAAHVGWSR